MEWEISQGTTHKQRTADIQGMLSKEELILPRSEPSIPSGHFCEHRSNTKQTEEVVFIYLNNQGKQAIFLRESKGVISEELEGGKKEENGVIVKANKLSN